MKAICKRELYPLHEFIRGMNNISCCGSFFTVGKAYKAEIDSYTAISDGNIISHFSVIVYDGDVDGYDTPTGVRFTDCTLANEYFTFTEA